MSAKQPPGSSHIRSGNFGSWTACNEAEKVLFDKTTWELPDIEKVS